MHLPEDAVLVPAKFLEVRIWTISEKMTQDVGSFAAIEDKVQLRLGDVASQRLQEEPPCLAMHRMTVDEDSIHVEDDAAQLSSNHKISPANAELAGRVHAPCGVAEAAISLWLGAAKSPSVPGHVACAFS